jgi:methyltransferase (TIGR00027 family)
MRLFIAVRSRFAEDSLAAAIERGVEQLVVLGAGLDTYAYRGTFRERLHIFEVDHPATQLWKRRRLAEAAIPVPDNLTFAPADFERQGLAEALAAAGFHPAQRTFFTWLGVVPYLSAEALGADVVFDYSDPPESYSPEMRMDHERRAARVAAVGEAWVNYFEADELRTKLTALGFPEVEDLGRRKWPRGILRRVGKRKRLPHEVGISCELRRWLRPEACRTMYKHVASSHSLYACFCSSVLRRGYQRGIGGTHRLPGRSL